MITRLIMLSCLLSVWGVSQGRDTSYADSIGIFNGIRLHGNVDAVCHINRDSIGIVRYANRSDKDMFYISRSGRVLTIQVMQDTGGQGDLPGIEVYADSIAMVENSYDSQLRICGKINSTSFQARQQGNGSIVIDSICADRIHLSVTAGKGSIKMLSGKTDLMNCRVTGTGSIDAIGIQVADGLISVLTARGLISACII